MKTCPKCGKVKDINEFYVEKSGKNKGLPTSWCKDCSAENSKQYYLRNKEKAKESHRKWVNENKEKVAFTKAKSAYGITKEEYDSLKKVCVICGSKDNLRIDHSHQTGRIRGMLCDSCNKGLGFFKDNPALLERASDYILGTAKPNIFEQTYELAE
jgi:hypothetical protein